MILPDRLIIAGTTNANKCAELQQVAQAYDLKIISLTEHQHQRGLSNPPVVDESERTYRGNALLKARAYAAWAKAPILADDSGLEVAALNGAPGVDSAYYLRPDATYAERMAQIVHEVAGKDRSAAFVCYLVLLDPSGEMIEADARLPGKILDQPVGAGGFGYDPIVFIPSIGKTLAEIDFAQTCKVGFRAQAANKLFAKL